MQSKTYELVGLAIAGSCLGFLLPYWVPDVVGTMAGQASAIAGVARGLTLDQYAGIGFWLGSLFVVRGFVGRWRSQSIERDRR